MPTEDVGASCPTHIIAWNQSTAVLTKGFLSLKELFLQLTDGPNRCAGNVEVFYLGGWVKVCGYLWDMQDAEVVCRQLGCGSPLSVMDYFPSYSYWYMLTEVDCEGSEDYLWYCPFREAYSDCYHGAASVICSGGFMLFSG